MTLILKKPTGSKLVFAKDFTWNETVWNPSMITTALWLDAADSSTLFTTDTGSTLATNGSAVGKWNDKSGNGRNFIQATSGVRPTYTTAAQNSRNVLTIELGQLLTYSSGGLLSNVSGGYMVVAGACTATGADEKVFMQIVTNASNTRMLLSKLSNNKLRTAGRRLDADSFAAVDGSTDIGTAGLIVSASVNYSATTLTSFRNGTQEAQSTSFQTAGSTPTDGGNAAIGNTVPAITNNYTGSIYEIIIGHSVPSTDTRQRIEGYLAHKWGLTANLPSNHPYKTVGPTP